MLFARQHQEMAKVREVLMIQDLLQRLKVDTVRSDFLNQRNGACPINKAEMDFIEKFAQQAVPVRPNFTNEPSFASGAKASAEVFSFLIDERNREFQGTGYTFEKGKELFNRIQSCGYWEKDMKFVAEESRAVNDSPDTDYLESKEEHSEEMGVKTLAAPAPTQVPTPTFNGNVNNIMPVQQQMQQMHLQKTRNTQQQAAPLSTLPSNAPNMKTTVTAVENAYFNQIKYSHSQQSGGQVMNNNNNTTPIPAPNQNDFGTNFSFLQDSELDSPAGAHGSQQQHKMPVNVIQPKHQQQVPQQFKNPNFHPQSPIAAAAAAGQIYPPGLKVQQLQNTVSHIPVNYQASPQQLNKQSAVPTTQVPSSHMIPKQQQPPINGNQSPGYGAQTPPITQRPAAGAAYPTMVSSAQYQVQQPVDPKNDEKEKQREEYQEQPQIDTWTNETAAQTGGNGSYSTRSSGGGYNRNTNRSSTTAGGAKYNNYR
jgi:Caprin-1 dimerization domain